MVRGAAAYFGTALQIELLKQPFQAIGATGKFDVQAKVSGEANRVSVARWFMVHLAHSQR